MARQILLTVTLAVDSGFENTSGGGRHMDCVFVGMKNCSPDLWTMKRKRYFITDADRCRLGALLTSCEGRAWGSANDLSTLDVRLEDADAIHSDKTPRSLVTMNSTVELLDIRSGALVRVTLVYPKDCDLVPNSVSILRPLGTELLGCHVGDIVSFGNRQYRVNGILYQPESAGAWHL